MTTLNLHYAPGFTIIQFAGEDNMIGRVWQEGGTLHFERNATEAAKQLFDQVIHRNNHFLVTVEEQNNNLHAELLAMEADRDRWKNHHQTEVTRARTEEPHGSAGRTQDALRSPAFVRSGCWNRDRRRGGECCN